jgi:hypothetical protein
MQDTAQPTGTRAETPAGRVSQPTGQETRPVRLLVPTVRRSDYWLPLEDTLRASDLGVTRHTTDLELLPLIEPAATLLAGAASSSKNFWARYWKANDRGQLNITAETTPAELTEIAARVFAAVPIENPAAYLFRIRDALRHPRDIAEAIDWGYDVPITDVENKEETSDDPKRRLGWWWVYDPERVETRQQREARYLGDQRLIDMKGVARLWCRAYITVKDFKVEGDQHRKVINNTDNLRTELAQSVAEEQGIPVDVVEAAMIRAAEQELLKAMCPRRDRAGQSDLWWVCDALKNGRDLGRLTEWYEYNKIKQTGRPKGSKTRTRATAPTR